MHYSESPPVHGTVQVGAEDEYETGEPEMKISIVQDGVVIAEFESEQDDPKNVAYLWGLVADEVATQQSNAFDMVYEYENESNE